jgi:hypothetical protein
LIKYAWIEKSIAGAGVWWGYLLDLDTPLEAALGAVVTDVIWIPLFLLAHVLVRRAAAQSA